MTDKKDTVVSRMYERCRNGIRKTMPLILLSTDDISLAQSIVKQHISGFSNYAPKTAEEAYAKAQGGFDFGIEHCQVHYNIVADPPFAKSGDNSLKPQFSISPTIYVFHIVSERGRGGANDRLIYWLGRYVERYVNFPEHRNSFVFLYGSIKQLPEDLMIYTEVVEEEFPTVPEIMDMIMEELESAAATVPGSKVDLDGEERMIREAALDLTGFGLTQTKTHIRSLVSGGNLSHIAILNRDERRSIISAEKKQMLLKNGGILDVSSEFAGSGWGVDVNVEDVKKMLPGMDRFFKWAERNNPRIQESGRFERERGIGSLRGLLMCGISGTGKSEAAKALSKFWALPLYVLSIDRLMAGLQGQSEENMRTALKLAEAMSPCILLIDELDKGFSAVKSGNSGNNDTFKRMFSHLLTWLQEHSAPVFIFATANDISGMPSEFLRSGRFDILFSVVMPTSKEVVEIFRARMRIADRNRRKAQKKAGNTDNYVSLFEDIDKFDSGEIISALLSDKSADRFVTGADIKKIVEMALADDEKDALFPKDSQPEKATIGGEKWKASLKKVVSGDDAPLTTYGNNTTNRMTIASLYLSLRDLNFEPVAERSNDLIDWSEYNSAEILKGKECELKVAGENLSEYDRRLAETIIENIKAICKDYELIKLKKTVGGA